MPRHPTRNNNGIPLLLIPHVILVWIRKLGEEPEWIRLRRSLHYLSTISVRTRPVKRKIGWAAPAAGGGDV